MINFESNVGREYLFSNIFCRYLLSDVCLAGEGVLQWLPTAALQIWALNTFGGLTFKNVHIWHTTIVIGMFIIVYT